jgi:queuosine precursor transporter
LWVVIAVWAEKTLLGARFGDPQGAYESILGFTPRLLAASFCAYLVGELINAFILARLKVLTEGRWLWTRTIGSTIIGQGLDSAIFVAIAFWGILPPAVVVTTIATQWLLKVAYEVLATPLTYWAVGFLKREEGVDIYDRDLGLRSLALTD